MPFGVKDTDSVPILLRTYVGGYMASTAKTPSATDATGRALKEGYVVCIPGSRGANSVVKRNGEEVYTGIAPNGLLDLKAAVRYLHYNDEVMPGDANRILRMEQVQEEPCRLCWGLPETGKTMNRIWKNGSSSGT